MRDGGAWQMVPRKTRENVSEELVGLSAPQKAASALRLVAGSQSRTAAGKEFCQSPTSPSMQDSHRDLGRPGAPLKGSPPGTGMQPWLVTQREQSPRGPSRPVPVTAFS